MDQTEEENRAGRELLGDPQGPGVAPTRRAFGGGGGSGQWRGEEPSLGGGLAAAGEDSLPPRGEKAWFCQGLLRTWAGDTEGGGHWGPEEGSLLIQTLCTL